MSVQPSFHTELFNYAQELGFGEIHFKLDKATGLVAIIAIHSTKRGPALGGCRWRNYATMDEAIEDVLRLAQGMTYKAAISRLPLGGGKSVLLKPAQDVDQETYFGVFGQFINDLGGRYITAVDSGTTPEMMDMIAKKTTYVTSTGKNNGDPSPFTAHGVCRAIQAAIKHKLGKDSLQGTHIAIQGVGNVGHYLARELHEAGAKLTVTDVNREAAKYCIDHFKAQFVSTEEIYATECDVFSPCALGAILNDETIPQLKAPIVVGSANNQLAEARHGQALFDRGILYGTDYVVNAGGLIHASTQYFKSPLTKVYEQVDRIYDNSLEIFQRSDKEKMPTNLIADKIAEEILAGDVEK